MPKFNFMDLPQELQEHIASLLNPKDLSSLRQVSSDQKKIVDNFILHSGYLPEFLGDLPHDQLILFVNTYQNLYEGEFAAKINTPQNLAILFRRLSGREAFEFIQTYHDLYGEQFDKDLKNFFYNSPNALFGLLTTMDRESAYQFTNIYPNWFAEKVASGKANMEEKMCYMLTVDDVSKIDWKLAEEVYRAQNVIAKEMGDDTVPDSKKKQIQITGSLGVMFYCNRLFQDPVTREFPRDANLKSLMETLSEYSHPFSHFKNLNCSNISIIGTNLQNSDFSEVNFTQARLILLSLTHCAFIHATLEGASLRNCNFTHANLSHGNLTKADFQECNLEHANLSHADLSKARFENCILTHLNLSYANLTGVNLVGVDLSTINLLKANLTDVKLIAEDHFENPTTLQNALTKFYDDVQDHPQYHELTKALASQIAKYVMVASKVNRSLAENLLTAAKQHGLFTRKDDVSQTTSMFHSGKSEAMKILDETERLLFYNLPNDRNFRKS